MADHPTKDELSGFVLGTLPPEATEAVAEHLEQCSPCQETAHRLDAHKDTLQQGLRRTPPPPVDESCRQAVEKVAAIASERKADPAPKPLETTSATIASGSGITKEQFLKSLQASGLFSADELRELADSAVFAAAPDGAVLARKLVEQTKLTKFQAQHLYQGKTRGFVYGEYVVLDRLGAGGMGQVYKARHRRMDRIVALKVISSASMKSADTVKRFQREVRAAAKLVHPNIVMAHDAGEQDGVHFLVMEYVEGQDLSVALKNTGPLPVRDAIDAVLQAARGLAFAHAEGVVHRDIKPANLLRDKKGTVKILDMGLARFDDPLGRAEDEGLTQSGQVMGTVDYMAPEQAFNTHDATTAADVYSLGCTLYRLLTGQPVFEGKTVVEKILAHRENPVPLLTKIRRDAPTELAALFEEMVAKSQADRPAMSQVVARLESLIATRPADGGQRSEVGGQKSVAAAVPAIAIEASKAESGKRKAEVSKARLEGQGGEGSAAVSASRKPPRTPRGKWIAVAAGGAALVLLLAGIIFKLQTSDGTLVVEINQPDAVVQVLNEEGEIEITQPGGAGQVSIGVDPGKHRLKVTKDGFQFFAQDFTMESGGEASIAAKLIPLKAVAVAPATDTAAAPFTDRTAAEWLLARGGRVDITVDGRKRTVATAEQLPAGAFAFYGLTINRQTISADDLARFDNIRIYYMDFMFSKLSEAAVAVIGRHRELKFLSFHSCQGITDVAIEHLRTCSDLETLSLSRTGTTKQCFPTIAMLKHLKLLELGHAPLLDDDLQPIVTLPELETLNLESASFSGTFAGKLGSPTFRSLGMQLCPVTREGIAAIASIRTLVHLRIRSSALQGEWLKALVDHRTLTDLDINSTPVGDEAIPYLIKIPKLTTVNIFGAFFTSTGIAQLRKAKPNLNIIGEPRTVAGETPPQPPVISPGDYALEFDGKSARVELPTLRIDSPAVTLEGWLIVSQQSPAAWTAVFAAGEP